MEGLSALDEPRTIDQLADELNTGVDDVEARVAYLQAFGRVRKTCDEITSTVE